MLDIGGPLGLHCTKLLADMGADVIKIEPPAGDESRRVPPFKDDTPHPEKSLYFLHFNTNKRGITLDVEKPDGRAILLELCKQSRRGDRNLSAVARQENWASPIKS